MKLLKVSYIKYYFYTIISLIALVYVIKVSKIILAPLLLAVLISVALYPILNWIQKRITSRILSVSLLIFVLSTLLGAILYLMVLQFANFYEDYPNISNKLSHLLKQVEGVIKSELGLSSFNLAEMTQENSAEILSSGANNSILSILKSFTGLLTYLILIPLYIFLMLYYKPAIKRLVQISLEKLEIKATTVIKETSVLVQNYLKGMFTVMVILGFLNSLGLLLLGVPYAFILGFMVAVFGIVPYIGTLMGSVLVLIVSFLSQGDYLTLLYIVILFASIQFLEGNLLTPKIVGNKVNVNPFIAIIALLIGDQIWGVVGMIIALPSASIIMLIIKQLKSNAFYAEGEKVIKEG